MFGNLYKKVVSKIEEKYVNKTIGNKRIIFVSIYPYTRGTSI